MLRHGHPPWRPRSRPLVNPRCGFTVARSPLPRRPASKQAKLDVTHEHAGTEPTGRRLTRVGRMRPTGRRRGGDPGLAFLNSPARKQGPPEQVHCRALPLTARLIHPCGVPKPARAHTPSHCEGGVYYVPFISKTDLSAVRVHMHLWTPACLLLE